MPDPSTPQLQLQPATARDVEALVRLMHAFYAESNHTLDPRWAAASFGALLGNTALGGAWMVRCGDLPVGYGVLTVRHTMEVGGLSGYIDDLFVEPAFRGRGAGRLLLSGLLADCRHRGCRSVHVEAGDSNAPALALYARFGLQPPTDGRVLLSCVLPSAGG